MPMSTNVWTKFDLWFFAQKNMQPAKVKITVQSKVSYIFLFFLKIKA